jgi:hypothetical protein
MSEQVQPDALALHAAEEILRTIYGDDLAGCAVTLEQIALPIQHALSQSRSDTKDLLEVYEKVVEAIHLLSNPPENAKTLDANALRSLLGERLDMIRSITQRTIETTSRAKA